MKKSVAYIKKACSLLGNSVFKCSNILKKRVSSQGFYKNFVKILRKEFALEQLVVEAFWELFCGTICMTFFDHCFFVFNFQLCGGNVFSAVTQTIEQICRVWAIVLLKIW